MFKTQEVCEVCKRLDWPLNDLHHIKTRGSGGTDDEWNLMPLCRRHHQQVHRVGLITFIKIHPSVRQYLQDRKWEYCKAAGKWIRPIENGEEHA